MSSLATAPCTPKTSVNEAVAHEAFTGLTATPRTLSPWLFYDEAGSAFFEQITALPEYYLTRTERALFTAHADEILELAAAGRSLTMVELGAGTATKTGILLRAAVRRQSHVTYQPIDVSQTSLAEAQTNIESSIPGVTVVPHLANYVTQTITLARPPQTRGATRTLALYIGSSIGNFSPEQSREILCNLREQLEPGDALLLGTDLAPGPWKSVATLLAAYDDAAGVTAAFNRNILTRLNRDLGADFDTTRFAHRALWNVTESRIEMHLEALRSQCVHIPENTSSPALTLEFRPGETIHTEDSYKFTAASVDALLGDCRFALTKTFTDPQALFAVTLAVAE